MLLDVLIILYLIPFTILGYRDGLLKKFFGITSSILALIVATKSMSVVGKWISAGLSLAARPSTTAAFFVVYLSLTTIKFLVFRWWKKKNTGGTEPKIVLRIAGAVLGTFQGAIITSLLLIVLIYINFPSSKMMQESFLYNKFFHIAPKVFDYSTLWIPDSKAFFEELKSQFGTIKPPE